MIVCIFLLLVTGLLKKVKWIDRIHEALKRKLLLRYQVTLDYSTFKLMGVNGLSMTAVNYRDERRGLSLLAEELKIRINISRLRSCRKISLLTVTNAVLKIQGRSSDTTANARTNYDAILKNIYKSTFRKARHLHKYLPITLHLTNVDIMADQSGNRRINIYTCLLKKDTCMLKMKVLQAGKEHQLELQGRTHITTAAAALKMEFEIDSKWVINGASSPVSMADKALQLNMAISWKTAYSSHCSLGVKANTLVLENIPGLDSRPGSLQLDLVGNMDHTGFFIQDTATIRFNDLTISGFLKHLFSGDGSLETNIRLKPCTMEELLSALPAFQYKALYSATYKGELGAAATLKMKLQPPFRFEWQLLPDNNITVINPGQLNLDRLNSSFIHTVYEQERELKALTLDSTGANFLPLHKIPVHLRNAILISEDRKFYKHKGIDLAAIGQAIMVNLVTRRFTRGASTLSMQLIRNLFLHKDRTVYRKIEELLLTWLMEDVFKVSKNRILELYLNIIEFGPGIHGIKAAADFYFSKSPESLSLTECLTLSYIVPRPKFFIEALKQGSCILYENLTKHLDSISEEMFESGLLTVEEKNDRQQELTFANGLGSIPLDDYMKRLHPSLRTIFMNAAEAWDLQYGELPKPGISRTEQSPRTKEASVCYILFRDRFGINRSATSLFVKFAGLIAAADLTGEISWDGNAPDKQDIACFRVKNVHLNITNKVIVNGSVSDL
ncbi:transglycosylase domain-containing protein [Chitinophaga pendula]|uniref:biosynthetic peptidoglycan transglycosylase n=1 Tax=Chitinophaga TaxID=79328 RepID=UPI000BAFCBDE|nr:MULTISPECIES: biosynthetic peptidoglycan transglycosylase [Chitinophaga]ASZ11873.1 hypothetical protein CK934_13345 [Chitinophaga sp. MD30]UCJ05102.1 transglycosylase domain-containing protein [Chitinophaga pendula]